MAWEGQTTPREWMKASKARTRAVLRGSVELMAEEMTTTRANGGRLPHKTGNLMRSILASTVALPPMGPAGAQYTGSNVGAVVAEWDGASDIWLGYQANYAHRLNYGFVGQDRLGRVYNQAGAHFIQAAIDAWPTIVELVADDVMRKVTSRG